MIDTSSKQYSIHIYSLCEDEDGNEDESSGSENSSESESFSIGNTFIARLSDISISLIALSPIIEFECSLADTHVCVDTKSGDTYLVHPVLFSTVLSYVEETLTQNHCSLPT